MRASKSHRTLLVLFILAVVSTQAMLFGTTSSTSTEVKKSKSKKAKAKTQAKSTKATAASRLRKPVAVTPTSTSLSRGFVARPSVYRPSYVKGGPWKEPTFADSADGDAMEGEDPQVRRAAVEALGPYNGTVVVADPY